MGGAWIACTIVVLEFVKAESASSISIAVLAVSGLASNDGLGDWVVTEAISRLDTITSQWSFAAGAVASTVTAAS